jgi:hypothetical protein
MKELAKVQSIVFTGSAAQFGRLAVAFNEMLAELAKAREREAAE